jgi:ATP-dependent DNA ligase
MTVITIQLLGLEGVVSKKLSAPRSGPSKAWLKIKNPKHPPQLAL